MWHLLCFPFCFAAPFFGRRLDLVIFSLVIVFKIIFRFFISLYNLLHKPLSSSPPSKPFFQFRFFFNKHRRFDYILTIRRIVVAITTIEYALVIAFFIADLFE